MGPDEEWLEEDVWEDWPEDWDADDWESLFAGPEPNENELDFLTDEEDLT